jgi:hypothetical protein
MFQAAIGAHDVLPVKINGEIYAPMPLAANADGPVQCRQRRGGVLQYYYHGAAA